MSKEVWKSVKRFNKSHQVSTYGRVRSVTRFVRGYGNSVYLVKGRLLKPTPDKDGYLHVTLKRNGRKKSTTVHRLVLETFVGECPEGYETRHLDNNRTNNKLTNLEWSSRGVNLQDREKFGVMFRKRRERAKLNETKVRWARKAYQDGDMNKTNLAWILGVTWQTVYSMLKGEIWQRT